MGYGVQCAKERGPEGKKSRPAGRSRPYCCTWPTTARARLRRSGTYLKDEHNIKSSKDVRLHLEDLSADDRLALLLKISHGTGNANSYRIREGFNGLKRLHNYLNGQGLVPALMRTRYFTDYIDSMDFETKVRTNIARNSLLELYEGMLDDAGCARIRTMLRDVDPETVRR